MLRSLTRSWFPILAVVAASLTGRAQTTFIHVPSDVAASHLKSNPAPQYPPLAEAARIQGNVILRVEIDEAGQASPLSLVSGHPMLVPAAMQAVRGWKYSPFEVNGHAVSVRTIVGVRFGDPFNHDASDRAEVMFLDRFWVATDRARSALDNSDLQASEQYLADAKALLTSAPPPSHVPEHWEYSMLMGRFYHDQKRLGDAEQQYTQALDLEKANKESPETAASLGALGRLYYESSRPQPAQDVLKRALSIYQKNYKKAARSPEDRTMYGHSIADTALMLSKIAVSEKQPEEAVRQCRYVIDVKVAVGEGDPDVQECERLIATPSSPTP